MALRLLELSLRCQQRAKIDVSLRRTGTQPYRLREFLRCFIGSPGVVQLGGVINMGARTGWKIGNDRRQTFEFTSATVRFGEPKHAKRNDEDSDPLHAVQSPPRQKTTQRNICCATGDAKRLPRRLFANLPH